jgi:superfamily II DNA or RNA helicase
MKLRPYQLLAVENAIKQMADHGSTLIVLPTGTGKTVCFSALADHYWKSSRKRTMVVAHRTELIDQAADKIKRVTSIEPDIDMADRVADIGMWKSPFVVASVQTLTSTKGRRLIKFDPKEFGLLIIDEAHHAVAESYRRVIAHFAGHAHICGVTATPDRGDEIAMGNVFKSVAVNYSIADAIRDGWLTRVKQKTVYVESLDYSNVGISMGDLKDTDIAKAQGTETTLHAMCAPLVDLAGDRRTLVFTAAGYTDDEEEKVKVASRVEEILNRYRPGKVARVHQRTPTNERKRIISDFAAGKIQFLVNVGVFTEGFDDPGVSCVAVMRPTKSRALYAQMIGRGTRPLAGVVDQHETAQERCAAIANSDKRDVLVLDFEGKNGRHKLVHAADVLGGDELPEVVERANRRAKDGDGGDVMDELDKIKAEIRQREEERRRRAVLATVKYKSFEIDPFAVIGLPPMATNTNDPPTERQLQALRNFGFPAEKVKSKKQASAVIADMIRRLEEGKPSFRDLMRQRNAQARGAVATRLGFSQ